MVYMEKIKIKTNIYFFLLLENFIIFQKLQFESYIKKLK